MNCDDDLEDALAPLRRDAVGSTEWREPADVARLARRRAFRRRGGSAVVAGVLVAGALIATSSTDGGHHDEVVPGLVVHDRSGSAVQLVAATHESTPAADPKAEAAVVRAEQAFTLDLLRHVPSGDNNLVLSPSSLAIALSMLQNGAAGTTRSEIAKVLHTSGLTNEQQDAGWAALTADLAAAGAKDGISVESANSLWLQHGLPMRQQFMAALDRYYATGVWQVDFAHHLPDAVDSINSWVSDHTHGKITKLFAPGALTPFTALVLANAVYFKADWLDPFNPAVTHDGPFRLGDGTSARVPFMSTESSRANPSVSITPGYDAAQFPYSGGRFAAVALMPNNQDLTSFVDDLDTAQLSQVMAGLADRDVEVRLPRFTVRSYKELGHTLATMGMPTAFGDAADFTAMTPMATMVGKVVQRDYLRVDEKGTVAAAATGSSGVLSSLTLAPTITFDHPFLFLIRDTTTGAILFAAEINNPAAG